MHGWTNKPSFSATPAPEHVQGILPVEHADPAGLDRRDPPHRPHQMDVVGFPGGGEELHAYLPGKAVPLPIIAGRTGGNDVAPDVLTSAGNREDVVPRQELASLEFASVTTTVLAGVIVTSEQECVGDLATEATRDVHITYEPNHRRAR